MQYLLSGGVNPEQALSHSGLAPRTTRFAKVTKLAVRGLIPEQCIIRSDFTPRMANVAVWFVKPKQQQTHNGSS